MWCSRGASVTALVLSLAACGFTPLYGPDAPASRMAGRVEVATLQGAPGFRLREQLTGRLGPAIEPTHRLEIALDLEQTGVALTEQNFTTRYNVVGTADFRLVPLAGGPPVLTGQVRAITGYSAPASETASAFATLAAERDAEQRVARDLADKILQRLALSAGTWT
jgi:LPS-assembly lipoprotein